jgi:hypothetical protein
MAKQEHEVINLWNKFESAVDGNGTNKTSQVTAPTLVDEKFYAFKFTRC